MVPVRLGPRPTNFQLVIVLARSTGKMPVVRDGQRCLPFVLRFHQQLSTQDLTSRGDIQVAHLVTEEIRHLALAASGQITHRAELRVKIAPTSIIFAIYRFGITKVCPGANFFGSLMTSRLASRICFQRVDVL